MLCTRSSYENCIINSKPISVGLAKVDYLYIFSWYNGKDKTQFPAELPKYKSRFTKVNNRELSIMHTYKNAYCKLFLREWEHIVSNN